MKAHRTALVYLIIAAAVGLFGAVYEHFSFGVYSNCMIYAFAFPLLMGVLPNMLIIPSKAHTSERTAGSLRRFIFEVISSGMYHAAVASLTAGSIMKGIIEIYGTSNKLLIVYPAAALILVFAAVVKEILSEDGEEKEARKLLTGNGEIVYCSNPGSLVQNRQYHSCGYSDNYAGNSSAE